MHSKQKQRLGRNCTVFLLSACASCVSISAYAAGKTFAKPARIAPAKSNENLNLQPASSQGGLLGDDDCEDDYATQVMTRNQLINAAPTAANAPSAPIAAPARQEVKDNQRQAYFKNSASMDTVVLAAQDKENKTTTDSRAPQPAKSTFSKLPSTSRSDTPAPAAPIGQVWEIALSDKTLNGAIARWTSSAGWQLLWELPVDYAIEARTAIPGTFEEAVETVARSMETAEIPMKAIFYKGNKVLRIVKKGGK